MTFHARLTELIEKGDYTKVAILCVNHAEAIRDLVVAAEAAYIAGPENHELADVLAKLEEA